MTAYIVGFWATPTMTAGQLLLAIGMTVYILGAIHGKERDMARALGAPYLEYKRTTPMLIPLPRKPPRREAVLK